MGLPWLTALMGRVEKKRTRNAFPTVHVLRPFWQSAAKSQVDVSQHNAHANRYSRQQTIPIASFSCGKVIGDKWNAHSTLQGHKRRVRPHKHER
jgi:hypothetical protein